MKSSFWTKTTKLAQLQELVKIHDLRFVGNPLISGERAYVTVDSDHLPMEKCLAFREDWEAVNTPIIETRATKRKLMKNKFNSLMSSVRSIWRKNV